MPVQSPNLDDLRYQAVRDDLVRRIPVHAPEWTDFNESDPGITLIELFAILAEQVGFRLNQVPEKNYIELLKLLGIKLLPARAATTRLAFFLPNPVAAIAAALPAGTIAKAKKGAPPPAFEVDTSFDIVPAEPSVLVATAAAKLWDLLDGGQLPAAINPPKMPVDRSDWLTVVWDGAKPALKDMPLQPVPTFPVPAQNYLWLGVQANTIIDAGFLGVRVDLTVQFDDDERPDLSYNASCDGTTPAEAAPDAIDWLWYFDAPSQTMQPISGRIDDATAGLTRSGVLRFTIPATVGPIPASLFRNLRDASTISAAQQCNSLSLGLRTRIAPLSVGGDPAVFMSNLQTAITGAVNDAQAAAATPAPLVLHPLDPKYRDPNKVQAWLRLGPFTNPGNPSLRMVVFNAGNVTNATTVNRELLGQANGRPGQTFQLANTGVLPGTLTVGIQEDPGGPLIRWIPVDSLDAAGPFDRQVEVDCEAGTLLFGDGRRGLIPQFTIGAGNIVALSYRYGGGEAGNVPPGNVTSLQSPLNAVSGCTNFVSADGGTDAETLDDAKVRARKELSVRDRAVTASDFEWIATQTPSVQVAKAVAIPLRRPLPAGAVPALTGVNCTPAPSRTAGIDDLTVAAGVVSVVAVPNDDGPEPTPTPSFLRAVCAYLNLHRLITTELYVIPPQFARLCQFRISVKARPGYTRSMVQDLVQAKLGQYLHVLKGGDDGLGFGFGGQLHAADLVALLFRVEGVERVDSLTALFTRTKTNASPRQGRLTLCGASADDYTLLQLAPEETVSVDLSTLLLSTVD